MKHDDIDNGQHNRHITHNKISNKKKFLCSFHHFKTKLPITGTA